MYFSWKRVFPEDTESVCSLVGEEVLSQGILLSIPTPNIQDLYSYNMSKQANDVAKIQIPKALKHQTLCFKISYNRTIIATSNLQKNPQNPMEAKNS